MTDGSAPTAGNPAPERTTLHAPALAPSGARALVWIRAAFWTGGIAIALWQALIYRNWINGDAISYLDMSDGVASGQWMRLVNGAWSPLYPFVLGVTAAVTRPTPYWQFTVMHVAMLLCFLVSFGSFEFLLRSVTASLAHDTDEQGAPLPVWACTIIGYALFVWGMLGLVGLMRPTPDMLMSGFVFLALGIIQRMRNGNDRIALYVALGVTLALGYLAKAIMFPLGFVLLAIALVIRRGPRVNAPRVALSLAVFLTLSAPYIVAVSRLTHRVTFGESATVVHLLFVDRVEKGTYWQGPGGGTGTLLHPPRKIFDNPEAYEFDRPISVTKPLWYDPTYWAAGVRPQFHLRPQLSALRANLAIYVRTVWETAGLVIVALILYVTAGAARARRSLLELWPLWALSLVALGAYSLVHVEERYLGAFAAVLWLGLICGARLARAVSPLVTSGVVAAVVLTLAVATTVQVRSDIDAELYKVGFQDYEAAVALHQLGLARGDRVARVSAYVADGWARLAGVKIVAEVRRTTAEDFWKASPDVQHQLLRAFANAGASAVIALRAPTPLPQGWQPLGTSSYAVFMEPPQTGPRPAE